MAVGVLEQARHAAAGGDAEPLGRDEPLAQLALELGALRPDGEQAAVDGWPARGGFGAGLIGLGAVGAGRMLCREERLRSGDDVRGETERRVHEWVLAPGFWAP